MRLVRQLIWSLQKGFPFWWDQNQVGSCATSWRHFNFDIPPHCRLSYHVHLSQQAHPSWRGLHHLSVHLWSIFMLLQSRVYRAPPTSSSFLSIMLIRKQLTSNIRYWLSINEFWRGHMPFPCFALGIMSGALCPLVRLKICIGVKRWRRLNWVR